MCVRLLQTGEYFFAHSRFLFLHESGSFVPYDVQCGSTPAIYGLVACLVVELVLAWKVRFSISEKKLNDFSLSVFDRAFVTDTGKRLSYF